MHRYITEFGHLKPNVFKSEHERYWLAREVNTSCWGFAVLEKNPFGFYNIINFRDIELMTEPGQFLEVRDKLVGKI